MNSWRISRNLSPARGLQARYLSVAALIIVLLLGSLQWNAALAATIVVNTTSDIIADEGLCSLREAIASANFNTSSGVTPGECPAGSGADVITLGAGTYTLSIPGTGENLGQTGDLDVGEDLTITGAGAASTIIDGAGLDRIFEVFAILGPVSLELQSLTVQNGTETNGAGIHNTGDLILDQVTVKSNTGIGIYTVGQSLSITDSTVSDNTENGIYSHGGVGPTITTVLINSDISDNGLYGYAADNTTNTISGGQITFNGGGVWASGNLTMSNVGVAWNGPAVDGAGVLLSNNSASATITDCVIRGNTASGRGGGIYYYGLPAGYLTVTGGTIEVNSAADGGGIYIDAGGVAFDSVEVIDNSTTNHGGGVYVGTLNDAGLTAVGGTTFGKSGHPNIADSDLVAGGLGGGVYVEGVLRTFDAHFNHNIGAGIFNNEGVLVLDNGQVIGNSIEGIKSYKATTPLLVVDLADMDIQDNGSWGLSAQNVDLTLTGGTISGNDGGIYGSGAFEISQATIIENHAMDNKRAGGLRLDVHDVSGAPDSEIKYSTISDNSVVGPGGGLRFFGQTNGTLWMTNVTISGNTATEDGGGIYMDPGSAGGLALNNVTVTGNTADSLGTDLYDGGGIFNSTSAVAYIANSILAANSDLSTLGPSTSAPDCAGIVSSGGYNLIGAENATLCTITDSTTGNIMGTYTLPLAPGLGLLVDNGGTTPTHALLTGSLAIDA
ncbi:MAG: right-handed parallel beta-helix repeat-containing protein, partial [Anaerolineales bacterium]